MIGWGAGVILSGGILVSGEAFAQTSSSSGSGAAASSSAGLATQRSTAIYNFKTTADSGPLRGEEIYYFKCWICHNQYTIKAGTGAVPLKDLFKRPRLSTGEPVNDQTVADKIKNGSPRMPAYRHILSDKDLEDLLSYLRDAKCCFEGDEPPRNPAYRY
jgi:mono/diheme cytochrome c family protein